MATDQQAGVPALIGHEGNGRVGGVGHGRNQRACGSAAGLACMMAQSARRRGGRYAGVGVRCVRIGCAYRMCVSDVRIGEEHARHDRQMSSRPSPTVRPFLKWAGNKYRILAQIKAALPRQAADRAIRQVGKARVRQHGLCALSVGRRQPGPDPRSTAICGREPALHRALPLVLRRKTTRALRITICARFNQTADVLEKAALFVYLNRHCYNGLCRYESLKRRLLACPLTANVNPTSPPAGAGAFPRAGAPGGVRLRRLVRRWRVRSRGMLSIAIRLCAAVGDGQLHELQRAAVRRRRAAGISGWPKKAGGRGRIW